MLGQLGVYRRVYRAWVCAWLLLLLLPQDASITALPANKRICFFMFFILVGAKISLFPFKTLKDCYLSV